MLQSGFNVSICVQIAMPMAHQEIATKLAHLVHVVLLSTRKPMSVPILTAKRCAPILRGQYQDAVTLTLVQSTRTPLEVIAMTRYFLPQYKEILTLFYLVLETPHIHSYKTLITICKTFRHVSMGFSFRLNMGSMSAI